RRHRTRAGARPAAAGSEGSGGVGGDTGDVRIMVRLPRFGTIASNGDGDSAAPTPTHGPLPSEAASTHDGTPPPMSLETQAQRLIETLEELGGSAGNGRLST